MTSLPEPKTSVIIPTLYAKRPKNLKYLLAERYTLAQVLADLERHLVQPAEVIVVCNGADAALRDLVQGHPRVDKYVINSVNAGVARSWNMGAMMAEGDALCFLNDDVEVGARGVDLLHEALVHDASVGVVGPRGAVWKGASHDRWVGEDAPEDADCLSGFCFMVRTDLFHRVGGFDVAYTPAGFEEIDFCFAIRRLGYRCRVVPGLPIIHHHRHGVSASTGAVTYLNRSIDIKALAERNRAYFQRKWQIPD